MYSIAEIKQKLKNTLRDKPVTKVVLFGSYAKGTADELSDIDFVIETSHKLKGFGFYGLAENIASTFDTEVDVIPGQSIIAGSRIDKEIKSTGMVVYEREN